MLWLPPRAVCTCPPLSWLFEGWPVAAWWSVPRLCARVSAAGRTQAARTARARLVSRDALAALA
jgi:hypothetical protein